MGLGYYTVNVGDGSYFFSPHHIVTICRPRAHSDYEKGERMWD